MERKKIWSKYDLTISNFLKNISLVTIVLAWLWQQLSIIVFSPESKFNVYLCNLRWWHNRSQTLRRCYWSIFSFQALKIWEIDLLDTCYIHTDFQISTICRTTELEVPIPIFIFSFFIFCTSVRNYILNCCRQKVNNFTFTYPKNTGVWKLEKKAKFFKLNPMKFIYYHNIPIFPKPT